MSLRSPQIPKWVLYFQFGRDLKLATMWDLEEKLPVQEKWLEKSIQPRSMECNRQTATPKVGTVFDVKPYVLQEDTSEDGAATEQQGQQTHQSHQDVEELAGIALT